MGYRGESAILRISLSLFLSFFISGIACALSIAVGVGSVIVSYVEGAAVTHSEEMGIVDAHSYAQ